MDSARQTIWDNIEGVIQYGFETYKDFVFGLIIGLFVAWIYHRFLGSYSLRKSYEKLLSGKDETIAAYRALVSERLDKMKTPEYDKDFFKKIKKFFRRSNY